MEDRSGYSVEFDVYHSPFELILMSIQDGGEKKDE